MTSMLPRLLLASLIGLLLAVGGGARAQSISITGPSADVAVGTAFQIRVAYTLQTGTYDQVAIVVPSLPGAALNLLSTAPPGGFSTACVSGTCTFTASNYQAVGTAASGEILIDLIFPRWSVPKGTQRAWTATMRATRAGVQLFEVTSLPFTVTADAEFRLFWQDLQYFYGLVPTWFTVPANSLGVPVGLSGRIHRYSIRLRSEGSGWVGDDTSVTLTIPTGLYVVSVFASQDNNGQPSVYKPLNGASGTEDTHTLLPDLSSWMSTPSLASFIAANPGRILSGVFDITARPNAWASGGTVTAVFHAPLVGPPGGGSTYSQHLVLDLFVPCNKMGTSFPTVTASVAATEVTASGTIPRSLTGTLNHGTASTACAAPGSLDKSGPVTAGMGQSISWGLYIAGPPAGTVTRAVLVDRLPAEVFPPYSISFNYPNSGSVPGARFGRYLCYLPTIAAGVEDITYDDFLTYLHLDQDQLFAQSYSAIMATDLANTCLASQRLAALTGTAGVVDVADVPLSWGGRATHAVLVPETVAGAVTGQWGSSDAGRTDLACTISAKIGNPIASEILHNDAFFHLALNGSEVGTFGIQWNAGATAWNEAADGWDERVNTLVPTTSGPRFMDQPAGSNIPSSMLLPRGTSSAPTVGQFAVRVGADDTRPIPRNPNYAINVVDLTPGDGFHPRDGIRITGVIPSYTCPSTETPGAPQLPLLGNPTSWPVSARFTNSGADFFGFSYYCMTLTISFQVDPGYSWVDDEIVTFHLVTSADNARPAADNPLDEWNTSFNMRVPGEQKAVVEAQCQTNHAAQFRISGRNTGGRALAASVLDFDVPAGTTLDGVVDVSVAAAGGTITLLDAGGALTTNLAAARKVRASLGDFPTLAPDRTFVARIVDGQSLGTSIVGAANMSSASGLADAAASDDFVVGTCLTVTKYWDGDGSGTRGDTEPALAGWSYTVSDGITSRTVTTGVDGAVTFMVEPGTFSISEVLPLGGEGTWSVTSPAGGSYVDVLVPRAVGLFPFGNQCSCDGVDEDNDLCTTAVCEPNGGCTDGTPVVCDGGDACGTSSCVDGVCVYESVHTCDPAWFFAAVKNEQGRIQGAIRCTIDLGSEPVCEEVLGQPGRLKVFRTLDATTFMCGWAPDDQVEAH